MESHLIIFGGIDEHHYQVSIRAWTYGPDEPVVGGADRDAVGPDCQPDAADCYADAPNCVANAVDRESDSADRYSESVHGDASSADHNTIDQHHRSSAHNSQYRHARGNNTWFDCESDNAGICSVRPEHRHNVDRHKCDGHAVHRLDLDWYDYWIDHAGQHEQRHVDQFHDAEFDNPVDQSRHVHDHVGHNQHIRQPVSDYDARTYRPLSWRPGGLTARRSYPWQKKISPYLESTRR